ncbi:MAG: DUF2460 domain-containing protein [Selenomonadaceae bacterium]|nr:DUF2460 domain-containing protein [Selenomonadaceae bacterium]
MGTKIGFLQTTTATRLDCTGYSAVTGIKISASIPDGCAVHAIVKVGDGSWKKYNASSAAWEDVATQTPTGASVYEEGNTKAELEAVPEAKLSGLHGQYVDIALALSMDDTKTNTPSVSGITISGKSESKGISCDAFTLSDNDAAVEITSIKVDKEETGGGTVSVLASILGDNGIWSDYKDYASYVTTPATTAKAIRFKAVLKAPTPGTSVAKLNSVSVNHRTDNVSVFSDGTGVCISKTYNFVNGINRAHLILKHPVVQDTEFSAEISLRKPTTSITGEVLGTGDGTAHTYTLKHTDGLASHGFALYFDGVRQAASKYSYSPNDGQVTCTADAGVAITADYIYGWTAEQFQAMTHDTQYPDKQDNSLVFDQFDYIATKDSDLRGPIGCVRVNIVQKTGSVKDAALGTGTGEMQSYKLEHHAKAETISVKPAGAKWKYRDATDVLQVTAAKGEAVSVSYDWAARPNYIEDLSCFFNE